MGVLGLRLSAEVSGVEGLGYLGCMGFGLWGAQLQSLHPTPPPLPEPSPAWPCGFYPNLIQVQ